MVRPPVLRTKEGDGDRRSTWTELFFDLVFVAAVSRTSQILAGDPSGAGAAWFALVFVAVTWTWTNYVMYTDRFDTDDVPHRLTKAAAMVGVAGLAYTATDARGGGAVEFALAYVAVRLVLIGLYVRAWRHVIEVRSAITVYIVGFSLGAACWAASVFVEGEWRAALWFAALVIEALTVVVGWSRLGEAAAAAEHLEERAGQFTLIVLGEAVIRAVDGLDGVHWTGSVVLTALSVVVVIVSIWWLTFDFVQKVPSGLRALGALSGHIPTYTAIAALGVGFELALHHADHAALFEAGRWILCGGAALYLVGVTCVAVAGGHGVRSIAVHPMTAVVLLAVAAFGSSFPAPAVVAVVAAALVAELLYKGTVFGWTGGAAAVSGAE
ncbi:MAG: low temperature requirement protein A [Acidimicrobiia bacterium]|nr:low temperature requirement protein A [Acidimicrobiia bacterium]